jgi:CRP-like cAMP-binding protein
MIRNFILKALPPPDRTLLEPHMEAVALPAGTHLQAHNRRVEYAYFLVSGIASVAAFRKQRDRRIEVAMIGREGMSGIAIVLGNSIRTPYQTSVLVEGEAFRIRAALLRTAMANPILRDALLAYALSFMEQLTQTALANGVATIEERLARWLLLAADRTALKVLPLTHETFADALGVRRAGVTAATQKLEREGVVGTRRGYITILDRDTLEERARGIYTRPNSN